MNAVIFERFGEPAEVLQVRDVPKPEPGRGEVRVRMLASPVNPSDLLVVRGRYGVLPELPATPGFEGVGVVDAVGPGLNLLGRRVKGKRVLAINSRGGNWAEYAIIPSRQARPIPDDIPDEQAATAFVNPATALALVRHVLRVPKGAWLLQTAAGSELGRMIIRLGKHDGFRTLNVVRRPEAAAELEALGADAVICSGRGPIDEQVRATVGRDEVRYALDPVGGEIGTQAFRSISPDGRMVVYGSLSEEPIQVESRRMIAGKRIIQGFWLGHWMRERSIPQALALFREIFGLTRAGVLGSSIGETVGIEQIREAARNADQAARRGKILLRLGPR